MISFDVLGVPMPQGSKRAFVANGRAMMKETGGNKHAQWRNAVADKAREARDEHGAIVGPVRAVVEFRFPMPKSRPKATRLLGTAPKLTAPDIDKLLRAVFDGLQAGALIPDDSLVVSVVATKVEVTDWFGAHVWLGPW